MFLEPGTRYQFHSSYQRTARIHLNWTTSSSCEYLVKSRSLVQLDLDFVVTSERLWGDHATVPSLAVYEALRDPSQRGIAQYEYRWDGRQLRAIG